MTVFTLSVANAGTTSGLWGDLAIVFSASQGTGASTAGTGSGAPSLAITTTEPHSAIVALVMDWNGVSGSSRVWRAINGYTPTSGNGEELAYTLESGNYAAYAAYWPDSGATAGSKTVGLTAPTGTEYTIIAIEVLGEPTALVTAGDASNAAVDSAQSATTISASDASNTAVDSASQADANVVTASDASTGNDVANIASGAIPIIITFPF